jgi:hypothetical protein
MRPRVTTVTMVTRARARESSKAVATRLRCLLKGGVPIGVRYSLGGGAAEVGVPGIRGRWLYTPFHRALTSKLCSTYNTKDTKLSARPHPKAGRGYGGVIPSEVLYDVLCGAPHSFRSARGQGCRCRRGALRRLNGLGRGRDRHRERRSSGFRCRRLGLGCWSRRALCTAPRRPSRKRGWRLRTRRLRVGGARCLRAGERLGTAWGRNPRGGASRRRLSR